MSTLEPRVPAALERVVSTCLAKDPDERWQSAGDLARELKGIASGSHAAAQPAILHSARSSRVAMGLVGIAAAVLGAAIVFAAFSLRPETPVDAPAYHVTIEPVPGMDGLTIQAAEISPDGQNLLLNGQAASGGSRLWVRPLHGLVATPLAGAEAALAPFWSAHGRSVGFFSPGDGAVKRIDLAGGPAVVVGPGGFPGRGTWNRDGIILRGGFGIHQLAAAGGAPVRVTTLDESRGETRHVDPRFLPDGRHFLFLAIGRRDGGVVNADAANGVYVGTLGSNEQKLLLPDAGSAAYGSGHLLFMRGRTLMAQPFDVERLELGGEARPLVDGVSLAGSGPGAAMASFSVSATGVLVYRHGSSSPLSRLVWFDRSGRQEDALGEPANYSDLALSPEGRRVAVAIAQEGGAADLFVHDLGGTRTRLTTDEGDQSQPVWSPDGKRILFRTNYNTGAGGDFRVKDATGGAEEVLQKNPATTTRPLAWSPDGRFILFTQGAGGGGGRRDDLWLLPVARPGDARGAEAAPVRFAETPLRENEARFSPDGRWIAYDAGRDAGRRDVYVASFPAAAGPVQVSTAGGMAPTWRGDGGEIYYVSPDRKMMAAEVNGRGAAFQVGTPRVLFDVPRMVNVFEYAVTADGKRFLVNQREDSELPGVGLVVNWPSLLK